MMALTQIQHFRQVKLATLSLLLCALSLIPVQPALAQAKEAKEPSASEDALTVSRSLADMGAGRDPLHLSSWKAAYVLKLPMSPRETLRSARLTLSTVNSTALIKSRSELSVRVNDRIIAQFALDPINTANTREISLPVELLKPGYNDVTFAVVQHYTYDCEDPDSPELWTEINPIQSRLTLQFSGLRANLDPKLSQLHIAFDRRGWLPRPLSVVSGTEHISEAQLAASALVVQGLALRMGYRPLDIAVYGASTGASIAPEHTRFPGLSSVVVKGRDVLLVGRRSELSRYLDSDLYKSTAAGPFVGIFSAMEGDSIVLVVSGDTEEELMRAARTLAQPGFKFSDASTETIQDQWAFEQPHVAVPDKADPFSAFDFRTTTSRGLHTGLSVLEFRAPADYGARKGDLGSVRLHFSYGAGLREDSALNVRLNGQFAIAVPLNEKGGSEFQKFEIRIPAEFVKPGYNTLTFEPVFLAHKGRCEMLRDENLVLTVYEDSTLELPSATVLPVAPDLARFAQSFWTQEGKLRLYLTQRDTETAAAALSFVGSLAQKNRAPFEIELQYSPFSEGNMLVLGPASPMAEFVNKALPLHRYAYSVQGTNAAFLQAVEGRRVITAFVADRSRTLKEALRVLDSKGLWLGMSGQAAIVDTLEQTLVTEPATTTESFGAMSHLSISLGNWRRLAALAAVLAGIFAVTFVGLLRRKAVARQQADS